MIALWLDLTIRSKSNGRYSLDTLMRELWIHFGRTGQGTTEDDFINIANVLCSSGDKKEDITDVFKQHLYSKKTIDLSKTLAPFGVVWSKEKFIAPNRMATTNDKTYRAYFGAHYNSADGGLKITQVLEDSPAAQAGIAVNDVLIAIDQLKTTDKSLVNYLHHIPENTEVTCHYFRDDQLLTGKCTITDSPSTAVGLKVVDEKLVQHWQQIID